MIADGLVLVIEPEAHCRESHQQQKCQHGLFREWKPAVAGKPFSSMEGQRTREEEINERAKELQVSAQATAAIAGLVHGRLRRTIFR